MSLFDINFSSPTLLSGYLERLGLSKRTPDLAFLNQLIHAHQSRVQFENFTRICDFKERVNAFPTLEESLRSIVGGAGCVCWTHARAFRWLLNELGFRTEYLYMEPGHVCVQVTLDQKYYVDVGYAAPFFEAKPLNASFTINALSEEFVFNLEADSALVTRTPGPTKKLHLRPFSPEEIEAQFLKGNVWKENRFLSETVILKYIDQKLVRLSGRTFLDYRSGVKVERELDEHEIDPILREVFLISPDLYRRARKYLA